MRKIVEDHVEKMAMLERMNELIRMSEELVETQVAFIHKLDISVIDKCDLEITARNSARAKADELTLLLKHLL